MPVAVLFCPYLFLRTKTGLAFWYMCTDNLRQFSNRDVLNRLKLKTDFDAVCTIRAQRTTSDQLTNQSYLDDLISSERVTCASKPGSMLSFSRKVCFVSSTSLRDIVHAMTCFHPHVMPSLLLAQISFCFSDLSQTFGLRFCIRGTSEADYRDEYLEFTEYFRKTFPISRTHQAKLKTWSTSSLLCLPFALARKCFIAFVDAYFA